MRPAQKASAATGAQVPAPGMPVSFSISPETAGQMAPRISELMGYLKELSDGRRLRGEQGGTWPGGMFSDN